MTPTPTSPPLGLFSPARPHLVPGRPCILGLEGTVVPHLTVWPRTPEWVEVGVMVKVGEGFQWRVEGMAPEDLPGFIGAWMANPEAMLEATFHWTPAQAAARPRPDPSPSAALPPDLGDIMDAL